MIEKINQESEEYLKWKQGSGTVDIDDKNVEVSTEEDLALELRSMGHAVHYN